MLTLPAGTVLNSELGEPGLGGDTLVWFCAALSQSLVSQSNDASGDVSQHTQLTAPTCLACSLANCYVTLCG